MSREICPACGEGELRPVAKEGRRMVFRHVPDLELPAALRIPTCTHCGEEVVDEASLRAIDRAAKQAYSQLLARRAEESIRRLGERISQREVERLLGLSHGYLSKLKSESAEVLPSAPLVAVLMLLASESVLVDRLRELWSVDARIEPALRWIRPVALSMNVKEGTGTTVEPPVRAPDSAGGLVIDALSCAA